MQRFLYQLCQWCFDDYIREHKVYHILSLINLWLRSAPQISRMFFWTTSVKSCNTHKIKIILYSAIKVRIEIHMPKCSFALGCRFADLLERLQIQSLYNKQTYYCCFIINRWIICNAVCNDNTLSSNPAKSKPSTDQYVTAW